GAGLEVEDLPQRVRVQPGAVVADEEVRHPAQALEAHADLRRRARLLGGVGGVVEQLLQHHLREARGGLSGHGLQLAQVELLAGPREREGGAVQLAVVPHCSAPCWGSMNSNSLALASAPPTARVPFATSRSTPKNCSACSHRVPVAALTPNNSA